MTFNDVITKLYEYYGYGLPPETKLRMAFEKIKNIPNDAADYILDHIISERDNPPRNLGKTFQEYYRIWAESHSRTKTPFKKTDCIDCGEEGLLHFYPANAKSGKKNRTLAICGACENWKQYGVRFAPMMFRKDIEKMGVMVDPPLKNFGEIPKMPEGDVPF